MPLAWLTFDPLAVMFSCPSPFPFCMGGEGALPRELCPQCRFVALLPFMAIPSTLTSLI